MNLPEWFRVPNVIPEGAIKPPVNPKDIDYSRVVSIAPNREELTFTTHDRTELVTVSYETLQHHQRRMTMREWREVEKALVKYGGLGFGTVQEVYQGNVEIAVNSYPDKPSERLTRQQAAQMARALPDPLNSDPGVSETQSIRADAKEVMNALEAMGATSDDAMAIILSEIAASDDPRAVASQWMTRFTNDVAAIIREGESDG